MRRRFSLLPIAVMLLLPIWASQARAHDGQVSLALGDLEVTQSVQTRPQVPADPGIGLSAHKPTAIRAYIRAQRYIHFSFFGFTIHFPVFVPAVSVNGTLTVKQGRPTLPPCRPTTVRTPVPPGPAPTPRNATTALPSNTPSPRT